MTLWLRIAALGPVALSLAACSGGSVASSLGMGKRSPDEFAVVRQQPLVIPPDFQLRPPGPGEATTAAGSAADRARANLTGQPLQPQPERPAAGVASSGAASEGTSALLARTNRAGTDPEIRRAATQETQPGAEVDESLVDRLLEWEQPEPQDVTQDAAADAERPSTNPIDGQSATADDAPTVVRRDQTPLGELVERTF